MIWYSGEAAVFLGGADAPLKFSKIIITKFSPCISSTTKAYAPSKIHVRFLLTHQIICPSNYMHVWTPKEQLVYFKSFVRAVTG
jgi:hypothetical protein